MPAIRDIDYHHLAKLAETSRVSFETLCKRAEKGEPLHHERMPNSEWVEYHDAADIMFTGYASLSSAMTHVCAELEYFGVRWKTKSKNNKLSKRGCGIMFNRADLVTVANIKRSASVSTLAALRVFEAMTQGQI